MPFPRWLPRIQWNSVKAVLLLAGVLGAVVALITGSLAGRGVSGVTGDIVNIHRFFGLITTIVFGTLLVSYVVGLRFQKNLHRCGTVALAVIGLLSVIITGALGAALVYGPSADPIVSFIYNFFF